jgi:hypothetical protein
VSSVIQEGIDALENGQETAVFESDGDGQQEVGAAPTAETGEAKTGTKLNSIKKKYERTVRLLKQSQQESADYKRKLQEVCWFFSLNCQLSSCQSIRLSSCVCFYIEIG